MRWTMRQTCTHMDRQHGTPLVSSLWLPGIFFIFTSLVYSWIPCHRCVLLIHICAQDEGLASFRHWQSAAISQQLSSLFALLSPPLHDSVACPHIYSTYVSFSLMTQHIRYNATNMTFIQTHWPIIQNVKRKYQWQAMQC